MPAGDCHCGKQNSTGPELTAHVSSQQTTDHSGTAQHSTAQHSTAFNAAQYSIAQYSLHRAQLLTSQSCQVQHSTRNMMTHSSSPFGKLPQKRSQVISSVPRLPYICSRADPKLRHHHSRTSGFRITWWGPVCRLASLQATS